jgi:AcrR family transcriptional regulator
MNEKQAAAAQTRERLIEAALQVLVDHGAQHLTLDLVARQAQVSKGGLLHHFRTKEALVEAIIRHLYDEFNACVKQFYDADPEPQGRWSRAYVRASFADFDIPLHVLIGLYNYVKDNEAVWQMVQDDLTVWETRFADDGIAPERAAIIRMACDSYWTEQSLQVKSQIPRDRLLAELLSLIT